MNLINREHLRECGDVLQLEHRENIPVPLACMGVEELDSRERHAERSVGKLQIILEIQEEPPHVLLGRLGGGALGKVRELANGPQVSISGSVGFPGQMKIIAHSLAEIGWKEMAEWLRAAEGCKLRHRVFLIQEEIL